MTLDEFLTKTGRGGAKEMAKAIGVPPSNVSMWRRNKQKPSPEKCRLIEKYTSGEVSRKEVRPGIFG